MCGEALDGAKTIAGPGREAYARASLPGRRTPWREARYCVVDLELSGLDPKTDEIIAFGAVPIDGGLVGAGRSLYGLARPTRPLPEASVVVHGIRTVDLDEAPPLELAIRPLLEALAGRVLVAHSAQVERAFLGAASPAPEGYGCVSRSRHGHTRTTFSWPSTGTRSRARPRSGSSQPHWVFPNTVPITPSATPSRPRRSSWRSPRI